MHELGLVKVDYVCVVVRKRVLPINSWSHTVRVAALTHSFCRLRFDEELLLLQSLEGDFDPAVKGKGAVQAQEQHVGSQRIVPFIPNPVPLT